MLVVDGSFRSYREKLNDALRVLFCIALPSHCGSGQEPGLISRDARYGPHRPRTWIKNLERPSRKPHTTPEPLLIFARSFFTTSDTELPWLFLFLWEHEGGVRTAKPAHSIFKNTSFETHLCKTVKQTNKQTNERTNERTNEQTNKQTRLTCTSFVASEQSTF